MNEANLSTSRSDGVRPLDHEKLRVYQAAERLDELVLAACRRVPRGHAWLVDQAQRASGSVVLNIAEANGRSGADRTQHIRVARGSALECDSVAGLMLRRGILRPLERLEIRSIVSSIVSMLTKLGRLGVVPGA
jgi:four helix bundle protein